MPNKFNNTYRIPTNRLPGYDYGADGWYFVTICTKNRVHYFGEIVETRNCASLQPTETGIITNEYWLQIPQHYPFVQLDAFVVMPDHIHGILVFNKPEKTDWNPNQFGVQSLFRRYWNHNNYLGSIEPYPRAAMGGSVGLGYKINLKK